MEITESAVILIPLWKIQILFKDENKLSDDALWQEL